MTGAMTIIREPVLEKKSHPDSAVRYNPKKNPVLENAQSMVLPIRNLPNLWGREKYLTRRVLIYLAFIILCVGNDGERTDTYGKFFQCHHPLA